MVNAIRASVILAISALWVGNSTALPASITIVPVAPVQQSSDPTKANYYAEGDANQAGHAGTFVGVKVYVRETDANGDNPTEIGSDFATMNNTNTKYTFSKLYSFNPTKKYYMKAYLQVNENGAIKDIAETAWVVCPAAQGND